MKIIVLFLLLLISFCQIQILAQKNSKSEKELTAEEKVSQPVPVKFGRRNDGFTEKLKIRGVITEMTFAQAYCGTIFWSGTIKIKLLDKIESYPYENVFLVVPCFLDPDNENKYLNKIVNLEVSKLYEDYNRYSKKKPCYFEIITNNLDSGGVPFYCSGSGQEGLLKNMEQEKTSKKNQLGFLSTAVEQINGREGETATFFWRSSVNLELHGGGFAPRHLKRYASFGKISMP